MLRIRFFRTGKKNQPFFRLVVTDKRNPPRGGRFLEIVGFFNPFTKEKGLKAERIKYWLSVGAQPSDRVHNLLKGEGIIKTKKKPVHAKAKKKKEEEPAPAKVATGKKEKPTEEKPAEKRPSEEKPKKEEVKKKPKEQKQKPEQKPEPEKKEEK